MNIAKEVRALIAATKKCLGPRPCDFLLMAHEEGQSLTSEEMQLAQKSNTPILIRKHDGSFSMYGKLAGSAWAERSLNNLTVEQQKALTDLDFAKGVLKFEGDLLQNSDLISALEKGHSGTIYEQSLTDMFDNLLYAGIPELTKEPVYYPIYEIYANKENIPAEKKPGYIYLYIQDGQLYYQTQWVIEVSEQEEPFPVHTGIIDISDADLKLLQDVKFVDSPVKVGDAVRTLWYDISEEGCIYSVIDDRGKKRVGFIAPEPGCNLRDKLLKEIQQKKYCLDKSEHLKNLEKRIGKSVQDAKHMQPFYEDRNALPKWYAEIRNIETNFLNAAEELGGILCQKDFREIFKTEEDLKLIGKLKLNLTKIISSQHKISNRLKDFDNSFELIDYLQNAYGPEFDATLYSEMTTLMAKFDALLQQYSSQISEFFKRNPEAQDQNKLLYFLVRANLTGRFSTQYVLRRQMLFNAFADYLKIGHKKFHELTPMYSAVNKSAVAANKAKDGFLVDKIKDGKEDINSSGLKDLKSVISREQNLHKQLMLDLVKPIWTLLVLDTQNAMENGHIENKIAAFYLQRRILIEQLEKFKKGWNLLTDDAKGVVNAAIAAIVGSGCKLVYIERNNDHIIYRIRLQEGKEIEGVIDTTDLNHLEIPQVLDINDNCFTANILHAIAKKEHIPMPDNEDIAALLEAVTGMIDILSPENCSPPLENALSSRRKTMHLSRPESKLKSRDMGLDSIASPVPSRISTSVGGKNWADEKRKAVSNLVEEKKDSPIHHSHRDSSEGSPSPLSFLIRPVSGIMPKGKGPAFTTMLVEGRKSRRDPLDKAPTPPTRPASEPGATVLVEPIYGDLSVRTPPPSGYSILAATVSDSSSSGSESTSSLGSSRKGSQDRGLVESNRASTPSPSSIQAAPSPFSFFAIQPQAIVPIREDGKQDEASETQEKTNSIFVDENVDEKRKKLFEILKQDNTHETQEKINSIFVSEEVGKKQQELFATLKKGRKITKTEIVLMQNLCVAGDSAGLYLLAQAACKGDGGLEEDPAAAWHLAKLAWERTIKSESKKIIENFLRKIPREYENANCNSGLKIRIGEKDYNPKELHEAYKILKREQKITQDEIVLMQDLCVAGDADGLYLLAQAARNGDGGLKEDPAAAWHLAKLALKRTKEIKSQEKIVEFLSEIPVKYANAECKSDLKIRIREQDYNPKELHEAYLKEMAVSKSAESKPAAQASQVSVRYS